MQLNQVLEKINLSGMDGLFFYSDIHDSNFKLFSNRLKESLLKIKPDAVFCISNEPLILFFDNPTNIEELQKQIWNFNQTPAIFISNGNNWIIKNGFNFLKEKKELETLSNDVSDFDYFKIITGKTWEDYKHNFENKNRVDYFLLQNIETARQLLINKGKLDSKVANSLIGRVIFIRYLIDRKVELNKYDILKKEDFYTLLSNRTSAYKFFREIRNDFNGNLFPLEYEVNGVIINEDEYVKDLDLDIIISLLKGDKLDKEVTQVSLFDIYDFSIIPIEFISNVYEKFIGLTNQAEQGAYYTPLFLVDYIQKQTVAKYFQNNPQKFNCKVLDPACGSGIFLVESFRQIIAQYQKIHPDYNENEEKYENYRKDLKQLLLDNIFGIDRDENAISVAIFSLYITLLDYLTPKSIVGFTFPFLEGTNFLNEDFFSKIVEKSFKKHHFQFILGNPPWATKHAKSKQLFEKYIVERQSKENSNLEIENREIAEAFLVRVSDFNFDECALIVVSKILYKISRKKEKKGIFRNYFLNHFTIRQVFEMSSVRHQIFDKSNDRAIAPATILFYSKSNSNEVRKNVVNHITLKPNIFFETFKLIIIEKFDSKELLQSYFIDEDWIWKVFVYGNILDYHFIKRLKNNKSIYDYISDKSEFTFGKGIIVGGGDENPIDEHKKILYSVDSRGKGLKPFEIQYTKNFLLEHEYVHRQRRLELFKHPVLLVGKGISSSFMAKSAISYKDVVYTDAITGIKPLTKRAVKITDTLLALFNSELFSYFLTLTNSSIGIEREQSHDKDDKFSIPLVESNNDKIKLYLKKLSDTISTYNLSEFKDFQTLDLAKRIEYLKKEISSEIFNLYNLSSLEKNLVNYNKMIVIPMLKGKTTEKEIISNTIVYKGEILREYAKVFINHFEKRFNSEGRYFEIEIIYSNHTILMKFKVIPQVSEEEDCILWKNSGDKNLLQTIAKLSFENLSYNLYIQKDVKGFEENFFYVAKPNQFKSWHPALAHLDLAEFINALHNPKNN